jgi:HAMP domain-containing protein
MKSIQSRLVTGLGLIIVFFLMQAALVWWSQDTARRDVVDATRKNTLASSELSAMAVLAQQIRRYEKEYFVYVGNKERRDAYTKEWGDASDKLAKLLKTVRSNEGNAFNASDIAKVVTWTSASEFYASEMDKIFSAVNNQSLAAAATTTGTVAAISPVEANSMISAGKDRFSGVLIKGVAEMSVEKTKQTLALAEVASDGFSRLLYGVLGTVLIGVLIAMGLMFTLPKTVTGPLAVLTAAVDGISKGNVDKKMESTGIAEFEGLAAALERLRLGQQALVARLRR